ncbi:hypothetical protein ACS0TY_013923 [Phlomoides rotata]
MYNKVLWQVSSHFNDGWCFSACIDHRGTLEHPAITCTLEEEEGINCWGAAYCIVEGRKKKRRRWSIWSEENASMTRKLWLTFIK